MPLSQFVAKEYNQCTLCGSCTEHSQDLFGRNDLPNKALIVGYARSQYLPRQKITELYVYIYIYIYIYI